MGTLIDETGNRYGRLLVLERAEERAWGGQLAWLCECDCGVRMTAAGVSLRRGSTRSCGCLHRDYLMKQADAMRLPDGEASFRQVYSDYRSNALRRGIPFLLGIDEFRILITGRCHYCGAVNGNTRRSLYKTGDFQYTGIDRKDNNTDYTLENCVTCCATCNRAKGTMSYAAFQDWIKGLTEYVETSS